MSETRKCPDCTRPLQAFSIRAAGRPDTELERCTRCAGVWCEWGRLQPALGRAVEAELLGGATHRQCVLCRILLTPARLPGGQSVEACSACRGLFLDAEEFAQFLRPKSGAPATERARPAPARAAPAPPAPAPSPPPPASAQPPPLPPAAPMEKARPAPRQQETAEAHVAGAEQPNTFACVECGERAPLREGQMLRGGLACRACMSARRSGSELDIGAMLFGRKK